MVEIEIEIGIEIEIEIGIEIGIGIPVLYGALPCEQRTLCGRLCVRFRGSERGRLPLFNFRTNYSHDRITQNRCPWRQ